MLLQRPSSLTTPLTPQNSELSKNDKETEQTSELTELSIHRLVIVVTRSII